MTCLLNYTPDEQPELQWMAARADLEHRQAQHFHRTVFSSNSGSLKAWKLADQVQDTLWALSMVYSRALTDQVSCVHKYFLLCCAVPGYAGLGRALLCCAALCCTLLRQASLDCIVRCASWCHRCAHHCKHAAPSRNAHKRQDSFMHIMAGSDHCQYALQFRNPPSPLRRRCSTSRSCTATL